METSPIKNLWKIKWNFCLLCNVFHCISKAILQVFLHESYQFRILTTSYFSAFPKKSRIAAKHIFWTFKGIFRKRVAMLSKKGILWLSGLRWKQQSHGSRLPHRGLCESRKPEKKVQTQFTSSIQNVSDLWSSVSQQN